MKTLNPKLLLEVIDDKEGAMLFEAIKNNNALRLEELIDHGANAKSCLNIAVSYNHWDCVNLMITHPKCLAYPKKDDKILLLAAKDNHLPLVTTLLNLILIHDRKDFFKAEEILYKSKFLSSMGFDQLRRDPLNKYTSLHWAVEHNNTEMCALFTKFIYWPYDANYDIFAAVNTNNQTPLELALSLGYTACARNITKGMTLREASRILSDEDFCKIMLQDFRFGAYHFEHSHWHVKKAPILFQHILNLPLAEKKNALELALDEQTTMGVFFAQPKIKKKYYELLIRELNSVTEQSKDSIIVEKHRGSSTSHIFTTLSHSPLGSPNKLESTEFVPVYIQTNDLFAALPFVPTKEVAESKKMYSMDAI